MMKYIFVTRSGDILEILSQQMQFGDEYILFASYIAPANESKDSANIQTFIYTHEDLMLSDIISICYNKLNLSYSEILKCSDDCTYSNADLMRFLMCELGKN